MQLCGNQTIADSKPFSFPLTAEDAINWMYRMVKKVLSYLSNIDQKLQKGNRGVKISGLGGRDYGIIPAYMYKDTNNHIHHIIPNGNNWQSNPTSIDMQLVMDLNRQFARNVEKKQLGFRDLVKLFKIASIKLKWKETHGITSFVIRFGAAKALDESFSLLNQRNVAEIVDTFNEWIHCGFVVDPYTKEQLQFNSHQALSYEEVMCVLMCLDDQ